MNEKPKADIYDGDRLDALSLLQLTLLFEE